MIPNAAGMRLRFGGKEKRGQKKEKTKGSHLHYLPV